MTGTVWPVEVNPRYTASIEILERAAGQSLIAWHGRACTEGAAAVGIAGPGRPSCRPKEATLWGKRIVYARRRSLQIGAERSAHFLAAIAGTDDPPLADLPPAGSRID